MQTYIFAFLITLASAAWSQNASLSSARSPHGQERPSRSQSEVIEAGRQVLEQYADKRLAEAGFLDVTKSPYNAKGDGKTDDTTAIQQALRDARDARLVTWLPSGTYLLREPLQCVQGWIEPKGAAQGENRLRAEDYPCVLQGAGGALRPVLRLAANANGFSDPNDPRPLILIQARASKPPYDWTGAVSFNQFVSGIAVDIRGHAGAIGIDLQGAQGSGVQDVVIEAAGAYAGLRGLSGSGGSTHQVTVLGGRFGVISANPWGSRPAPLLAGATLIGQRDASILHDGRGPLTVVGAKIEGKGIVAIGRGGFYNGGLNVVDSSLNVADGPAITSNRPVYLNQTWVKGTSKIVNLNGGSSLTADQKDWTIVREFAGAPEGPFPVVVDGKVIKLVADVEVSSSLPPTDLQMRHLLPDWLSSWDASAKSNLGYKVEGIKGDGMVDDAPAIQRALDEYGTVFLPKGRYKLSRPLVLRAGRKLVGAGRRYTVLLPMHDAAAFRYPATPQPLIDTVDSVSGDTGIARLELRTVVPGAYALRWRAGANSAVIDVTFRRWPEEGDFDGPNVLVEGSGGGRWLNFETSLTSSAGENYRHILVRHTRQPLRFYMFNPEHGRSKVMSEFNDTHNVCIYSLKGESIEIGNESSGTRPLVWIHKSLKFKMFGGGGIGGVSRGSPRYIYRVDSSDDVLFANIAHQVDFSYFDSPESWVTISDLDAQLGSPILGSMFPVLYRRGPTLMSSKKDLNQ